MAYVMRIGGDHFEYRPLDFYWPLLAVPASVAILHLGGWLREWLRPQTKGRGRAPVVALGLFFPLLFYTTVVQNTYLLYWETKDDRPHLIRAVHQLMLRVPGTLPLFAIADELTRALMHQFVALRASGHRAFARPRIRAWAPYERLDRDVIPDDAVMAMGAIGIPSFYVPVLTVVDLYGLTDATVARHPVATPNRHRVMAHERRPPPGYLDERGVNFTLHPLMEDGLWALTRAHYAVRVGPDLWMPFDTPDHQWAVDRFSGRELRSAREFDGLRVLATFEDGLDGWQPGGDGNGTHSLHILSSRLPQMNQWPVIDYSGQGFLSSFHHRKGDAATATACSPEFTARPDESLAFLLAGGESERVGLRLLADGIEVHVWRGADPGIFTPVVYPLAAVAGKTLQLELFDDETAFLGRVMIDHVTLVRGAGNSGIRRSPSAAVTRIPWRGIEFYSLALRSSLSATSSAARIRRLCSGVLAGGLSWMEPTASRPRRTVSDRHAALLSRRQPLIGSCWTERSPSMPSCRGEPSARER